MTPSFLSDRTAIFLLCLALYQVHVLGYATNVNSAIDGAANGKLSMVTFSYNDQSTWAGQFPCCGGMRQSPINIEMSATKVVKAKPYLSTAYYSTNPLTMLLVNTGQIVTLTGTWAAGKRPYIYGGPLNDKYMFVEMQLHWAPNDTEHRFSNVSYALEMHFIHYKKSYGCMTEAMKRPDGIAILAILFETDTKDGAGNAMTSLVDNLHGLDNPGSTKRILPFPLAMFDVNLSNGGYVSYCGSLTMPPCSESVIWLIGVEIKSLLMRQTSPLMNLTQTRHKEQLNIRTLQPLNGRIVYYHPDRTT